MCTGGETLREEAALPPLVPACAQRGLPSPADSFPAAFTAGGGHIHAHLGSAGASADSEPQPGPSAQLAAATLTSSRAHAQGLPRESPRAHASFPRGRGPAWPTPSNPGERQEKRSPPSGARAVGGASRCLLGPAGSRPQSAANWRFEWRPTRSLSPTQRGRPKQCRLRR